MFTVGLYYYCYKGKATKRFLFSNIEEKKGKLWFLVSWNKGICLLGQSPLFSSSPHKGEAGTRQRECRCGIGYREKELSALPGENSPVLGTAQRCADSLFPLPLSPLSPRESLPSMSYTWKRNLSLSMGLPWMSRFRASFSSWRVMVPLPSESNRAKNRSAKKGCDGRRVETGRWDSDRTLVLSANKATPRLQCPWPIPPAKSKFGLW